MAKTKRATGAASDKPLADQMVDDVKNHPRFARLLASSMMLGSAITFTASALALVKDARELSAQHEEAGSQKFVFTGKTLDEALANAIHERDQWAEAVKSSAFAQTPTMAPAVAGTPNVLPFFGDTQAAYTDYIEKMQTQLSDMQRQLDAIKQAAPRTLDLDRVKPPPKVKF